MNQNINRVFKVFNEDQIKVFPPSQVFVNPDFKFLIALGGWLVDNNEQYDKLMTALKSFGETSIHILEQEPNDPNDRPFELELPTNSGIDALEEMTDELEPPGRWYSVNIFIYGNNPNWGIYVCEYPTILIIGCIEEYVPIFQEVYDIKGNGFAERDDFISREYESRSHLREELIKNYQLFDNQ